MTSIVQRVPSHLEDVEPWTNWKIEYVGHFPHELRPGDYDYPRYLDDIPGRWPVRRVRWAKSRPIWDRGPKEEKGPGWVLDLGEFEPRPKGASFKRGLVPDHLQGFRYLRDGELWTNKMQPEQVTASSVRRQLMRTRKDVGANDAENYLCRLIEEGNFTARNRRAQALVREGSTRFRDPVLRNFHYRCAVCGIGETNLLDAAHIDSYAEHPEVGLDPRNGVALCVLHHRAMDRGLLWIEKDGTIQIHRSLRFQGGLIKTVLGRFHGRSVGTHDEWVRFRGR